MEISKKIKLMVNSFIVHVTLLGLRKALIYLIQKHILYKKQLELNLKGYKYPIYLRNHTSDIRVFGQIFISGEYANTVVNNNPMVIIDCGANIGLASIYFKFHFPDVKIYAFEPEISNFKMLKKNVANYKDVFIFQKAIWYESANLNLMHHSSHDSFSVKEKFPGLNLGTIDAISINDIIVQQGISRIDLLKIDIEGAELPLFSYKTEWIDKVNVFIIEIHENINPGSTGFICNLMSKDFLKSESGEYLQFKRISSI